VQRTKAGKPMYVGPVNGEQWHGARNASAASDDRVHHSVRPMNDLATR